ncbi:unnamed protein product [Paramecium pentaurelia]|uniref:TLDc domain-containing protein n=1 Tax=Paramecium pentaurelia TaxID=43138 RepID=A0A8S1Y5N6_9CILI|nr:unnamed protein product [Paramecium pentaurelia]
MYNNLPFCPTHSYQILNLLELRKEDARLICGSCLLNLIKTQQQFDANKIVDLVQINDHPEKAFQFTDIKDKTDLVKFLNDQKEQLEVIKQAIDNLLIQLEQWQSELLQEQKTNFHNIIKLDEFKSNFQLLVNQNNSFKIEIIQQIQNKFYNYFQSIKVMNQVAKQEDLQNLEELYDKISKKVCKSEKFEDIFTLINKVELDYVKFSNPFWKLLMNTIQNNVKRQVSQKKPIYRSLEKGLTFQAIRNVIIGKENLLWFFKSSNNTEFGVFTPYIWHESGYSGTTENNPSFLFSKNLNQIYPIIQNMGNYTQWFNHNQYLLFGGTGNSDQDLRINPDFKSGYSRLGVVYKAPAGVDTSKYSTHLLGAMEPNVVECEIYQIIYE